MRYNLFVKFVFTAFLFLLAAPSVTFAAFVRQSNNPILLNDSPWETYFVAQPSLLIDNNIFNLWYAGSTGEKNQIGKAVGNSPESLTKNQNNPIIPWDFVNSQNIGIEHPSIIKRIINNNPKYEMWFNNVSSSEPIFSIFYTNSSDSISWSQPIPIIFNIQSNWDTQDKGAPKVIYDEQNNIYKMWYTARQNSPWLMGYATSSDGINWNKYPNPVLQPDSSWENVSGGNGITAGSILVENGKYYMFYHGDRDIGLATSNDGINWTKYTSNPIFSPDTSDENLFDFNRVTDADVFKYNNQFYMYYVGRNNGGQWQIGLAKSPNIPGEPEPSDTPTPTPSSTPTPTVTLTPTPTPTSGPAPFSPIIIIPGLGGSWNQADIFSCNPSTGGQWTATPFVDVYDRLINTLTKKAGLRMDKDVYFYTYDWRQPLPIQSLRLKKFIDTALAGRPGSKVKLVGHSLGGLVIRSYLTDYWSEDKVESAMTVGTPHQGTLLSYQLWEGGEIPKEFNIFNIALNQIIQYCRVDPLTLQIRSPRQVVQKLVPVVKSLLPTFDYLYKNHSVIPVAGMISQNDWLNLHLLPARHFFIPFQTLTGTGFKTLLSYSVKNPSKKEVKDGDWLDGKITDKRKNNEGDGTILLMSASDPQLPNETIFKDHGQLISSKEGVAKVLAFLNISAPPIDLETAESISQKTLSVSVDKPVSFTLVDPQKNTDSQKQLLIRANPSFGNYRIKIKGERNEKARIILSLFKDQEDPRNIDYPITLKKNKITEVLFSYPDDSSFAPKITLVQ